MTSKLLSLEGTLGKIDTKRYCYCGGSESTDIAISPLPEKTNGRENKRMRIEGNHGHLALFFGEKISLKYIKGDAIDGFVIQYKIRKLTYSDNRRT